MEGSPGKTGCAPSTRCDQMRAFVASGPPRSNLPPVVTAPPARKTMKDEGCAPKRNVNEISEQAARISGTPHNGERIRNLASYIFAVLRSLPVIYRATP
ncbi:hypothetical protein K0M31_013063 [Melipona bicolor]|uniref:Uncharacterized protein n=1 Tax=Melipona bicolor TaxID=60889 RepID=A0AA40FIS9_9HYME|nr:hypothetical protein K0M31_013063 [Melipona bicolor]